MPTAISTQCTVSSALRDCGGLLNSTVPQVLVLFRFQASSHSGESGCTDNKLFGRACFIEERKYGREVVRLYSLGVHFAQFRAFVVRSAQMVGDAHMQFRPCSGSASPMLRSNHNQPFASCFRSFRDHHLDKPTRMWVLQLVICSVFVLTSQTAPIPVTPRTRLL